MSYGREPSRKRLMFLDEGDVHAEAMEFDASGGACLPFSMYGHNEGLSLIIRYEAAAAVPVIAQTPDPFVAGEWINLEGEEFVLDTLPIAASATTRIIRLAGLPSLEFLRLFFDGAVDITGAFVVFA